MRFAFCGYDYSIDIAQALVEHGHELLSLFTFPCDQVFAFNHQTYALADSLKIPITEKRINDGHLTALIETHRIDVLIVAGYPNKIPPLDEKRAYGLNLHPALLPRARGITPLPYIIMQEPEAAGYTIHKLASEYDSGDILFQEAIPLTARMDVEELSAHIALRAQKAILDLFKDLPAAWQNAKPQNEKLAGNYGPVTNAVRTLDWQETSSNLELKGRAFGRFGVLAEIQNNTGERQKLGVFQFSTWQEKHSYPSGTMLRSSPREIIITCSDGYVLLKEFQVIA